MTNDTPTRSINTIIFMDQTTAVAFILPSDSSQQKEDVPLMLGHPL